MIFLLAATALAFFSGMQSAFFAANRLQIEWENQDQNVIHTVLAFLARHPSRFVSSMLLGSVLSLVIIGVYTPGLLGGYFEWTDSAAITIVLQAILVSVVITVVAVYLPKAIFGTWPNRLLKIFAIPVSVFVVLVYPLVGLINGVVRLVMHGLFRLEIPTLNALFRRMDIEGFMEDNSEDDDGDHEIEIFRNALEFKEIKAREFMIPRTEILAVDVTDDVATLRDKFIESGYSKILVYDDNMDHVIGYIHAYELFKRPKNIRSILRPVSFIPETMSANDALNLFTREKRNVAIVVDEFGGTDGLVTLEDVVEELFGDIDDEHDTDDVLEKKTGPREYLFSARLEIDYLNDEYDLRLPESENYTTLGGLLVDVLETIPDKGERLVLDDYILEVHRVSSNRLEEVRLLLR